MADLMQQAREQFETWAAGRGWSLSPARTNCDVAANGMYNHPAVQRCWEAWEAAALRAAPEGYVLVPVEPTPERMAAAALAVLTPANGDMELARRAAQIVIQSADAPHGITVDMIAASIATMAPAYRAMTAARPQGVR